MQQNNVLKGVILVGLGASFYGMLATFVKLAYKEGYTTAEVTTPQFVLGILGMLLLNLYQGSVFFVFLNYLIQFTRKIKTFLYS